VDEGAEPTLVLPVVPVAGVARDPALPEASVLEEAVRGVVPAPQRGAPRESLVRDAARRWCAQLIDLGGRNTLLYYRDLKVGTLDLAQGTDEVAVQALLTGRTVPLRQLFTEREAHARVLKRARTIRNKARELLEERGIQSCYVAVGMATWENQKGASTPAAPVLLRPAMLRARGAAEDEFDLTLDGDIEVNPTLLHLLATDFEVYVDGDDLAELVDYTSGFDPAPVYERLTKEAARVQGFAVNHRVVLGTFSYAKLPMVTDLSVAGESLIRHDVIAAIAGDRLAQQGLTAGFVAPDHRLPDDIPPADEFLVLDADSSQNLAINAVIAGQHTVIKGPPGTGKSQTIANLIATLVSRGKRVLFVAEKRAAITAVTDRLAKRGLGHLVMDVHDGTTSRRKVAAELKDSFDSASKIGLPELEVLHETVAARRAALNDHAQALHEAREPWGISAFQAQAALLDSATNSGPTSQVRLRGQVLHSLDSATARQVREELRDYATLGGFTLTERNSGWSRASVYTPGEAQHANELAERMTERTFPKARRALEYIARETAMPIPSDVDGWRKLLGYVDSVEATLRSYSETVFRTALEPLIAATATRAWRKENAGHPGADAGWLRRRALRKEAAALWRGSGKSNRAQLFRDLSAALEQRKEWKKYALDGGEPRLPAELGRARDDFRAFDEDLRQLSAYVPRLSLSAMDLDRLGRSLDGLASDERTLRKIPRMNELAAAFDRMGLDQLIVELEGRRADADTAGALFDYCWHASVLKQIEFSDPRIGAFDGGLQDRIVAEYRYADRRHIDATTNRVLRAVAEHITAARDRYPDESRLVEHQANLKRRHLPIRQLFATAPHLLTALKPCWAMSPLVVSQLLPADRQYFDVVVFDEASQVTPADAIPAVLRARQVVVAGDERQLPPTSFFMAADEPMEEPLGVTADGQIDLSLTAGYESVLDVLTALLPGYLLRWHYRSRDDRLIAFSNAHIYDRALVTFPGTAVEGGVTHVAVTQELPGETAEQVDSVGTEVERVVQLVLQHAAIRPNESLGVITMGITHAERIDAALRRALSARTELHGFFSESAAEPFFVKNLERVQGDERDAIILSVGYGKNAQGRLLYRFGPLLLPGGERRLNVAITRARVRMTVVSSFTSADMDPSRSTSDGVRLLRSYLEYAESAGASLATATGDKPPLGAFEVDVRDRLTTAGIPLRPQYGVAGYFIDFAAAHPSRPEEMVLAIESDGHMYHSFGTARDRDRLRQEHLERLGWRFHRIWSVDWYADPAGEVARAKTAYEEAVAVADARRSDDPTVLLEPPPPLAPPTVDEESARTLPRPELPTGRKIADYSHEQLVELMRWIESDTLLRTEDEVIAEAMKELGFRRKGTRITAALASALNDARGG
jgi:very-short-patch-repair endonuclease